MSKNKKSNFWGENKATFVAVSVLLTLIVVFGCVWYFNRPEPVKGNKTITIEITHKDQTVNTVEIFTDAEYLYDAMREQNLIGELDSGMFDTVDGETTDASNEEWWGYTKSGEYVSVGVSDCVIEDGDHYEFNFNVGYDWNFAKPDAEQENKTITVEIRHGDGSINTVEISTDAEYLYDAMYEKGLIGELDSGMFDTVDGETIDPFNEEWWGYTKSGEYVSVSVSDCVIEDGDHYEFNFNVGYENW